MEIETFFFQLSEFVLHLGQREASADSNVAEHFLERIGNYLQILNDMKTVLIEEGDEDISPVISTLMDDLEVIHGRWTNIEAGVHNLHVFSNICNPVRVHCEGQRGRRQLTIDYEKLQFLREIGLSWTKIAELFGVSRRTLYNIRLRYNMCDGLQSFTELSDNELLEVVEEIKHDMPEIGYNMLKGILRSRGINVPIIRIQQCIREVDPINTSLRWAAPTSRRRYGVPYPNFLWHIDGNHKLIR